MDWKRFPLKAIAEWAGMKDTRNLKDRAEEIVRASMNRAGGQQAAATALFRKNDLTPGQCKGGSLRTHGVVLAGDGSGK